MFDTFNDNDWQLNGTNKIKYKDKKMQKKRQKNIDT